MSLMPVVKSILGIVIAFALASTWLYFLTTYFSDAGIEVKFPQNLDELKDLSGHLKNIKGDHYNLVLIMFCSAYLYKQTFAIPGSVLMNLLGGALFGTKVAFPLVCVLTAIGATCCYTLSRIFGKNILIRYFPNRITAIESKINENRDHLFFFLLSARLFPFTPNWFMNMAFPVIGISYRLFFFSVLVGLMPYNYVCVETGAILTDLNSLNDIFTFKTLFGFFCIAVVAMIPGFLQRWKTPTTKAD